MYKFSSLNNLLLFKAYLYELLGREYDILICFYNNGIRAIHIDHKTEKFSASGKIAHFELELENDFQINIKRIVKTRASNLNYTQIYREFMVKVCGQEYVVALQEFLKENEHNQNY